MVNNLRNKHCSPGFTLIELMVVLVIISIVAAFAVLATGDFGQNRRVGIAAEEFLQNIRLASQQAILEPNVIGVAVTADGYRFYRYITNEQSGQSKWQIINNDRILHNHVWPSGIHAVTTPETIIIIDPTGEVSPFSVTLFRGRKSLYCIQETNDARFSITKVAPS